MTDRDVAENLPELYMPAPESLAVFSEAERMLAEIATAQDAMAVVDLAEAARLMAQQANLSTSTINYATVVKERALICLADIVDAGQAAGQIAPHGRPKKDPGIGSFLPGPSDLGTSSQRLSEGRLLRDQFGVDGVMARCEEHNKADRLLAHNRLLRIARDQVAAKRRQTQAAAAVLPPTIDIQLGDFREILDIEPGSAAAVITDPPYPEEFLALWSALAEHAARWLQPGGLLVALSGHMFLPEVMSRLGEHMDYWWCGSYQTPGPGYVSHVRNVHSQSKPLLFYVRRGDKPTVRIADTVSSHAKEKETHLWQQNLDAYKQMVERFSAAGDLVIDPFVGGGTTAMACLKLNRNFAGAEIDETAYHSALERLA